MTIETLEYIMSRTLLKELLKKKLINDKEFKEIDELNKKFIVNNGTCKE